MLLDYSDMTSVIHGQKRKPIIDYKSVNQKRLSHSVEVKNRPRGETSHRVGD